MALAIKASVISGTPFDGVDNGQKLIYVSGQITPSGNYPAGGDILDFTAMTFPAGGNIQSNYAPVPGSVNIVSNSSANGHSGFPYFYRPGAPATMQNGKMQVLNAGGGGNTLQDIGAQAYPAAVLADEIRFTAAFVRA